MDIVLHRNRSCFHYETTMISALSSPRWKIRTTCMQYTLQAIVDQRLVRVTWELLTMLGQLLIPTQSLAELTKHLRGTSATSEAQAPFSAEASTSLLQKFCTLSRTLSALHRKVSIVGNSVMHNSEKILPVRKLLIFLQKSCPDQWWF